MATPLLIDTDPGIDDALALLLALSSPEVAVEAISTVAGNVPVERATDNVFRILDIVRPSRRPRVARGAAAPLRRALVSAGHVHGEDGLGELGRFVEPDGRPRYPALTHELQMLDGADLILEMADRFPGDLVVVALGPLTNLALAVQRDLPRLAQVARIVVMGGAVGVPGNVTPAAEFNFYVDPEAARAVFGAELPLEMVPLDVTEQILLRQADLDGRLPSCPDRLARFISDFTAYGFGFARERGEGGIVLHDPLAVGVAVDPTLVGFEGMYVEVEAEGRATRGLSLAAGHPIPSSLRRSPNCRVATAVDVSRFLAFALERLCRASA